MAMTPSFCSLTDPSTYNKTHLNGLPMPKFEANINHLPSSPPSSMKQCNKSATVKFHMELLLILQPGNNLAVVRYLINLVLSHRQVPNIFMTYKGENLKYKISLSS